VLIPKALIPNGFIDVVRWCYEATDEVLERPVERTVEEFQDMEKESRRKEASVAVVRQEVRDVY